MPNIVNLPNDIYSGGSAVLNPQPYVNYIIQQQQRQQAKKEAVDNYYRDLSKTLTPAGMAGNDVEPFMNKVNSWKDFVTQNRNVLNNSNDKNYANVVNQESHLYNDALQHSAISKQKVSDLDKANQLRLSHPDYNFTDAGITSMDNAGKPIDNGYQPLDWSKLQYDNKPVDAKDLNSYAEYVSKGLQMNEGNPTVSTDSKTKTKIVTTTSSYSPAALNVMATRAETLYKSDTKFHNLVTQMSQDPANYNDLNNKFKSIYGHDLDIQHPEEFATALLLPQTEKINTQPYNFSPTNIKINLGDQAAPSLDNYISQLQQTAKQNPRTFTLKGKQVSTNYEIPSSPELSNAFAAKIGSSTVYPDQVQFDSNGNFVPIFYKYTQDPSNPKNSIKVLKDGKAVVDESLTHPVSMQEGRIRLAKEMFGEKGLMNVMKTSPQQQTALPQNNKKSKTYKGLDKNGNPIFE